MRLEFLALTNFRNFGRAELQPSAGINIFYGKNAAGKTNLLEAIFTLCLGRSQRGARDVMMVREGDEDFFRLEGIGYLGNEKSATGIACAYQAGGRKKITVDENPVRMSKLYQLFHLISMAPEDVTLFSGSPSGRRRFLDLYLSQASPSYLADLGDYNKALAQKNSFLKNGSDDECPFDPLMVQLGAKIMVARHRFMHFLQALAPGYYAQIAGQKTSDGLPSFTLRYLPNVEYNDFGEIEKQFEQKINAGRQKEAILETAIVGPHRDDIDFQIGGFPAKGYGSMGEQRSAAIAVMMATANFLESRTHEKPILLLDEIFAELDPLRRENVAGLFKQFKQVFLTTAVEPPEPLLKKAKLFYISEGIVTER
ncbi:MAG: DNA replication/repair protein RecF [Candidatus Zixiibacteriota bacterium]